MKILIIGGTGLISTAITRILVERGEDVTLYNRGQREARTPPVARTILGDRKDFTAFEPQMADAGAFACVIDMICFLPEEAESDPPGCPAFAWYLISSQSKRRKVARC